MTNLVDLARANYGPRHACRLCGVALRYVGERWTDSAGRHWCPDGMTAHQVVEVRPPAPVIAPSPLLRGGWAR